MSTVPAALDALVDAFRAGLPDTRVDDGPNAAPFERSEGMDLGVVVGWRREGPAVEMTIEREGAAGDDRELYRVHCAIIAFYGETASRPLREIIYTTYDAAVAAVRAQHPLTRGVLRARVELGDYEARAVEGGTEASLEFAVEVDAFDR